MSTPTLQVPEWAKEIKRKYLSQNISQFIIHGNINDYVPIKEGETARYPRLKEFLNNEMFRQRDIVVYYDRASGIRFKDDRIFGGEGKMRQDFVSTLKMFDELSGNEFSKLSREPGRAFLILDTYFNLCINQEFIEYLIGYVERLLQTSTGSDDGSGVAPETSKTEENEDIIQRFMNRSIGAVMDYMDETKNPSKTSSAASNVSKKLLNTLKERLDKQKSIAFIIDYAETIVGNDSRRPEDQMLQVFMRKWAQEEKFLNADMTIITLTENISGINQQYVRNPYTHEINMPYPDDDARLGFIQNFFETNEGSQELFEMDAEILAKNTAGLGLVHLDLIMAEAARNQIPFTNVELMAKKKEMIESEAGGLLEFLQPKYNLESVAGHAHAKKHLMNAATALKNGRGDVLPMGYLVSGPVGTGKTFMITCFANDIGVPMVMLKNFRGMYVGESEGNLQKVLKILKAMAPVAVMIDEADAYLGDRSSGGGGSGVNSRIFSMLATFMSNTENRGKIVWFLVTARPDLMPVDFKRQGRAEEHIALFYPDTMDEKKELLQVMLRKTGLDYITPEDFDEEFLEDMPIKSGADMEAALTRAKFKAASLGLEKVDTDVISQVFFDFLPPTYPEEVELMVYSAILECTSKELLPPKYRKLSREEVLEKIEDLKSHVR